MDDKEKRFRWIFALSAGAGMASGMGVSELSDRLMDNQLNATASTTTVYLVDYITFLSLYAMKEKKEYTDIKGKFMFKDFIKDKSSLLFNLIVLDAFIGPLSRGYVHKAFLDSGASPSVSSISSDISTDTLIYSAYRLQRKNNVGLDIGEFLGWSRFIYGGMSPAPDLTQSHPTYLSDYDSFGYNYERPLTNTSMGVAFRRQKKPYRIKVKKAS